MSMKYTGKITKIQGNAVTLLLNEPLDVQRATLYSPNDYISGELKVDDKRELSAVQRRKIYALIRDIALYSGDDPEYVKAWLKYYFIAATGNDYFSLSNCSMTLANDFINYLIEFCFKWGVPFKREGLEDMQEINHYLYLCLKYRKCAICGRPADVHHARDLVGRGRDRRKHDHTQSKFIALCGAHHTECHNTGLMSFEEKYHLVPIKLSKHDLKHLHVM